MDRRRIWQEQPGLRQFTVTGQLLPLLLHKDPAIALQVIAKDCSNAVYAAGMPARYWTISGS